VLAAALVLAAVTVTAAAVMGWYDWLTDKAARLAEVVTGRRPGGADAGAGSR
jgi:hypothetical protein